MSERHAISLSCVIPTLNAALVLAAAIASIRDGVDEVVVSDGGSRDETVAVAETLGAIAIRGPAGRGGQFARGIAVASEKWLLLLHADTVLAPGWREQAENLMRTGADRAGYFRFALDSDAPAARRLERLVAWRCRRLGLPYGDQGLLISRALLDRVGGMRDMPLMEDVDLARRLGRHRLTPLDADARTAADRWERDGYLLRSGRNLCCLSLYYMGVPPGLIRTFYG